MKKFLFIFSMLILLVTSLYSRVYATERLVDIPVPPDNHGMADFTENEAAELQKEYEQGVNNTSANTNGNIISSENSREQINKDNKYLYLLIIIVIIILVAIFVGLELKKKKDK